LTSSITNLIIRLEFERLKVVHNYQLVMIKLMNTKFSLELLKKLSFTKEFYKAVEGRLVPKGKYL